LTVQQVRKLLKFKRLLF